MATAIWDQSVTLATRGKNISAYVSADDFTLHEVTSLSSASVWLADYPSNGVLLSNFSGKISWGIFDDNAGNGPGMLLHSGSGNSVSQTSTGMSFIGEDIIRVDFSFGTSPLSLAPGTYWFALHEGNWEEAYDGSAVHWVGDENVRGQDSRTTRNGIDPDNGWLVIFSADETFILWDERPGAINDAVTTMKNAAVSIDFLANDFYDPIGASVTFTDPSYGTVTRNDNATANISDDTFNYTPAADFQGTDSFTYTLTIGNWSETATVTITVAPINDPPYFTGPSQLSIRENQFLVATLAATDADGDALTYSIVGGDDAALFTVNATSGALSFINAPDFEAPHSADGTNAYAVNVRVSDGAESASRLFAITVLDTAEIARFYNVTTGAHFYTADSTERDLLIATSADYVFEGETFSTAATAADGVSVHRFYNALTGAHFYTANGEEADFVRAELPQFSDEGEAFMAYSDAQSGRQAVHRFYNLETQAHFYTSNEAERDEILATLPQFSYEGVAFYVDLA